MDNHRPFAEDLPLDPYANNKDIPLSELTPDDPETTARNIITENLIPAVNSIVQMALYGKSESMRFKAATWIAEHQLGKPGGAGESNDVWGKLLSDIRKKS
jgi:hypothetical protein